MRQFLPIFLLLAAMLLVPSSFGADNDEQARELLRKREEAKRKYQENLSKIREKVKPLLAYDTELLELALRIKIIDKFSGAALVVKNPLADELKFLGTFENQYATDSIFNEYGNFGSRYATDSIWNEYGSYGGKYAANSPFNPYSSSAPLIVKDKKVIGVLTVNKMIEGAVVPNWLASYFKK